MNDFDTRLLDPRIIAVGIGLAVAAVSAIIQWRKKAAARNWPMVIGMVEQTCCDEVRRGRYAPGILYSYEVNGEYFSGQHRLPETRGSTEDALELARPWLKKKIFVRYKPGDPQTSAFLPEDPSP